MIKNYYNVYNQFIINFFSIFNQNYTTKVHNKFIDKSHSSAQKIYAT